MARHLPGLPQSAKFSTHSPIPSLSDSQLRRLPLWYGTSSSTSNVDALKAKTSFFPAESPRNLNYFLRLQLGTPRQRADRVLGAARLTWSIELLASGQTSFPCRSIPLWQSFTSLEPPQTSFYHLHSCTHLRTHAFGHWLPLQPKLQLRAVRCSFRLILDSRTNIEASASQ